MQPQEIINEKKQNYGNRCAHGNVACNGNAISRQWKNESVFSHSAMSDSLQHH